MKTLILALLAASIALAQTPAKDRDALQSLLEEVHQLRQAIEGMTAASQRVQIALYSLQMQDGAVARSSQRAEGVRTRCAALETSRERMQETVQREETNLASATPPPDLKARMPEIKMMLEQQTRELQTCRTTEAEASSQLRSEQAKLTELQDRIARLDKALEQLGSAAK